jgi:hypothetical protein
MDKSQGRAGLSPDALTRKERNHVALQAMLHMGWAGEALSPTFSDLPIKAERENAQQVAVLFNLREDLGWEVKVGRGGRRHWTLSLVPVAQLRALLRVWRRDAMGQLVHIERGLAEAIAADDIEREGGQREELARANRSLGRTCDLLARLEHQRDEAPAAPTPLRSAA